MAAVALLFSLSIGSHIQHQSANRMISSSIRTGFLRFADVARSFPLFGSQKVPRYFSSTDFDTSSFDNFIPTPPSKLTVEMAEGISDTTQFYIKHGLSSQRLKLLSRESEMPAVVKWQKMMEIFLTTQVHVIAGVGYSSDEHGLTKYAQDLAQCLQNECDDDTREFFTEIRRETWKDLVASAFGLEGDELKTISIVDARNLMHKVSSKMIEPSVLSEIQSRCAELPNMDTDAELMLAEKHKIVSQAELLFYPQQPSRSLIFSNWMNRISSNMLLFTTCTCRETRH